MTTISRVFESWRTSVAGITWGPLVRFSRSTVLAVLSRIESGRIVVVDGDGTTIHCGEVNESSKGPNAELRVVKDSFWVRALLFADMVRDNSLHRKKLVSGRRISTLRSRNLGLCRELYVGRDCVPEPGGLLPGCFVRSVLKESRSADSQRSSFSTALNSAMQQL